MSLVSVRPRGIEPWDEVVSRLPPALRGRLDGVPAAVRRTAEEIRLRPRVPVEVVGEGGGGFVDPQGRLTPEPRDGELEPALIHATLERLLEWSVYRAGEELRLGYLTLEGGHRVGLGGRTVLRRGRVHALRPVTCLAIRIAREVTGGAQELLRSLTAGGVMHSTLVVSPPRAGKTTLLRGLARLISAGGPGLPGRRVVVIDERSELGGARDGVAQRDLGPRTDLLDGCPKAEGILMAIRSLSPDLVVTDELGRDADVDAIREAVHAGVAVLASAHARDAADAKARPSLSPLFDGRSFTRVVTLSRRRGPGTVEAVQELGMQACSS